MENDEIKLAEDRILAEDVSNKINYDTIKAFLIKPLEPVKVEKEFSKPISKETKSDDNGIEACDYETVTSEIETVDADYRKGIVLKVPKNYLRNMQDEKYPAEPINVGDTVIYHYRDARWFDLLKDSVLIEPYAIVAIER